MALPFKQKGHAKKSPHKSNLFRCESNSKMPLGMALFVGLQGAATSPKM